MTSSERNSLIDALENTAYGLVLDARQLLDNAKTLVAQATKLRSDQVTEAILGPEVDDILNCTCEVCRGYREG